MQPGESPPDSVSAERELTVQGSLEVARLTTLLAAGREEPPLAPARVAVAVPTGIASSLERLAAIADEVLCVNVRPGASFAVADAYERWYDVSDEEAEALIARPRAEQRSRRGRGRAYFSTLKSLSGGIRTLAQTVCAPPADGHSSGAAMTGSGSAPALTIHLRRPAPSALKSAAAPMRQSAWL
ncbi:MAG: hypothetical protein RML56_00815 [Burkholderiales bacterium]|nr:hypothetical protein [Burkholderiales bacterium]